MDLFNIIKQYCDVVYSMQGANKLAIIALDKKRREIHNEAIKLLDGGRDKFRKLVIEYRKNEFYRNNATVEIVLPQHDFDRLPITLKRNLQISKRYIGYVHLRATVPPPSSVIIIVDKKELNSLRKFLPDCDSLKDSFIFN